MNKLAVLVLSPATEVFQNTINRSFLSTSKELPSAFNLYYRLYDIPALVRVAYKTSGWYTNIVQIHVTFTTGQEALCDYRYAWKTSLYHEDTQIKPSWAIMVCNRKSTQVIWIYSYTS